MMKCFTKHKKKLLKYFMIIQQWYLRLNLKQFMEKNLDIDS